MKTKQKNDTILFLVKFVLVAGVFLSLALLFSHFNKKKKVEISSTASFLDTDTKWADTLLNRLSLNDKIAQLILYEADTVNSTNSDSLLSIIKKNKPGGVIFSADSVNNYIDFVTKFQDSAQVPALSVNNSPDFLPIADKSFFGFPEKLAFKALSDDSLKKKYAEIMACFYKDININFNIFDKYEFETNDTVQTSKYIKTRSGFIKLFNKHKILSCFDEQKLDVSDSVSILKFSKLINQGLSAISLSNSNLTYKSGFDFKKQLFKELNFGGLLICDVSKSNEFSKDTLLQFLNQGSEMIISSNPEKTIKDIKLLVDLKKISEKTINKKVSKILLAKSWSGMQNITKINLDSLIKRYNNKETDKIKREIFRKSITAVKNKNNFIPFSTDIDFDAEIYAVGNEFPDEFINTINEYFDSKANYLKPEINAVVRLLNPSKNTVIISLNQLTMTAEIASKLKLLSKTKKIVIVNFGHPENSVIADSVDCFVQAYGNNKFEQKYAADVLFGGEASTGKLPVNISSVIKVGTSKNTVKTRLSFAIPEDVGLNSEILNRIDSIANDAIMRGATPGCQVFVAKNGRIVFNKSYGYFTYQKNQKVQNNSLYDIASVTKIAATTLACMKLYDQGKLQLDDKLEKFFKDTKIQYTRIKPDTIINIDTLLISEVKDFKKLLKKQDTVHINDSMIMAYDTLIVTSTPSNNIFKVTIRDLLLHQSGVSPALPILPYLLYKSNYYKEYQKKKKLKQDTSKLIDSIQSAVSTTYKDGAKQAFDRYYTHEFIKDSSETQIAKGLYLNKNYTDTLWIDTKQLRVYSRKIYQYTDVNMILLQHAVDSITKIGIYKFLNENFYNPLGLKTICYQPLEKFNKDRIVPTEDEKFWREQLLQGYVHDPSAAMLGGVSGNAGIFSNAYDLGVIGQMWLNKGTYGGKQYLSAKTVELFSSTQPDSYRGLGFDKGGKKAIIGNGAPSISFGHTGFTGTCIWVDPVNEIVYVFLSNRVNPSQKNWKLNNLRVRQKIHTVVYDSFMKEN